MHGFTYKTTGEEFEYKEGASASASLGSSAEFSVGSKLSAGISAAASFSMSTTFDVSLSNAWGFKLAGSSDHTIACGNSNSTYRGAVFTESNNCLLDRGGKAIVLSGGGQPGKAPVLKDHGVVLLDDKRASLTFIDKSEKPLDPKSESIGSHDIGVDEVVMAIGLLVSGACAALATKFAKNTQDTLFADYVFRIEAITTALFGIAMSQKTLRSAEESQIAAGPKLVSKYPSVKKFSAFLAEKSQAKMVKFEGTHSGTPTDASYVSCQEKKIELTADKKQKAFKAEFAAKTFLDAKDKFGLRAAKKSRIVAEKRGIVIEAPKIVLAGATQYKIGNAFKVLK